MIVIKPLILLLIYLLFPIMFLYLMNELQNGKQKKNKTNRLSNKNNEVTLSSIERYKLKFLFAIKEATKKRVILVLFIGVGLAISVLYGLILDKFLSGILMALIGSVVINTVIIAIMTKKEYDARLQFISDTLDYKRSNMGLINPSSNKYYYTGEFQITKWAENNVEPTEIKFFVPVNFALTGRTSFVEKFCERFDRENLNWTVSEDGWSTKEVTLELAPFITGEQAVFVRNFLIFKKNAMGMVNNDVGLFTYQDEFQITQWDDSNMPTKLRIKFPITFPPAQQDDFLDKLSSQFGRGRPWEIDQCAKDNPGWDYGTQIASLILQQPLPDKAPWSEKYLLNDTVQWSYFPLGIGSRGGIPFKDPFTGEMIQLVGFDVNGAQRKFCSKNGIWTGPDLMSSPHALLCGVTGGGKSVLQRNVILSCLLRPEDWQLFIIDMKMVEGAMYRKFGVPVATTYRQAAMFIAKAQELMLKRFRRMEELGVNDYKDVPEEERGPAIMINVDEISELLAVSKVKGEEGEEKAEFQGVCLAGLESIARLGRAARVHLFLAGQRPDADVVSMQIRQNCPTRLGAGAVPATISQMVFENNFGATIPSSPPGRIGIKIHSAPPFKAQGFFADEDWLEDYLTEQGKPLNVYSAIASKQEEIADEEEEDDDIEQAMSDEEYEMFSI